MLDFFLMMASIYFGVFFGAVVLGWGFDLLVRFSRFMHHKAKGK